MMYRAFFDSVFGIAVCDYISLAQSQVKAAWSCELGRFGIEKELG